MGLKTADPHGSVAGRGYFRNRHEAYLQAYFQWLDDKKPARPQARRVTVIARSPASPAIAAIIAKADELAARDVTVQAVFSDPGPEKALHAAWKAVSRLSRGRDHGELLRWAAHAGVLEAHEQMVLGGRMNWLGDAMRREAGRRDAFDIFETDAPDACRLAMQSFAAMWDFATPLPDWMLRRASERRPNATFAGPDPRALATLSFFHKLEKPDTLCH